MQSYLHFYVNNSLLCRMESWVAWLDLLSREFAACLELKSRMWRDSRDFSVLSTLAPLSGRRDLESIKHDYRALGWFSRAGRHRRSLLDPVTERQELHGILKSNWLHNCCWHQVLGGVWPWDHLWGAWTARKRKKLVISGCDRQQEGFGVHNTVSLTWPLEADGADGSPKTISKYMKKGKWLEVVS